MQSTRWYKRWLHVIFPAVLGLIWAAMAPAESPSMTRLTPETAIAGDADFTLTLQGRNFTRASIVLWNGAPLETAYQSETELTATIPASLIAYPGAISVTVRTEDVDTPSVTFRVNPPPEEVAEPLAALGAASRLPSSTRRATEYAQAAALLAPPSAPSLLPPAFSPAGSAASTSNLAAANQSSGATSSPASDSTKSTIINSSSPNFALSAGLPPTISSLAPTSAFAGGSDLILTINGMNFTATSSVLWGSTALATTFVSATQLTATVPAALIANTGTASITISDLGGSSSSATFTILQPPPVLLCLNPASTIAGGAAFTLTLTGMNFTSSSSASWGSNTLTTTYVTSTQLTATVPATLIASVGTAAITVSNAGGVSSAFTFTVNPPAPTITSLSPSIALAGGAAFTLTLTGTNFTSTSKVSFGATQLTASYVSATQLTATVPAALTASAGAAAVTVSNVTGTSSGATFTINPPPPTIIGLNPAFAVVGSPAFTMTLTGTNFTSTSTVLWASTPLTVTYVSSTQLTAAVPASYISITGSPSITVSNVSGKSTGVAFPVNPPAPTLTGLSPATAYAGSAAFSLTLTGTNFTSTSTVSFGATQLAASYVNAAKMTATVPAALISSVGTAAVTVTNVTGTSPGATFSINQPPPAITSLSPASTVAGGADLLLSITGTNFDAAAVAYCGSTALPTTLVSSTQLTATLPAALTANFGTVSITVSTDGGASSATAFNIIPQPPTITTLSPSTAVAGGAAFTMTITGTNFTSASAVMWNTSKPITTYVSVTQLTVAIPPSLIGTVGSPSVTVTTTGGVSPAATFTVNPSAPTITSLSPSIVVVGGAGYTLTINGTNFTAASTVLWGSTSLTATCVSATQMTATVPAALIASVGTAAVTVTNVTGTSSSAKVTINPLPPTITSLTPGSILMNNGAFTMTVNGTNFQPGAGANVVRWGNTALAATYLNSTQVTATVPANLLPYGSASVYVITAGGISSGFPFTVILPPPTITTMAMTRVPAGYGSFTTSVYGTYFTSTMVLNWGATQLSGTLVGGSTFTFTIPASLVATVGPVSLTVTTVGGTSAPVTFTVTQPQPILTSISPTSIAAGSAAFTLTVNGSNFIQPMNTRWGSTWVGATVISATQLTVTIPASMVATAGTAGVMVYSPSGGISASLPFTINPAPPVITSLSPNSASAGGAGFMLTIKGVALTTSSTVMWGTNPLDTIYVSPTQLLASVPASLILNSGNASISVVSSAGASVSATFITNPAGPQICGLNPGVAAAGGAAFTLTISGEYFTASTTSKWGSTALATTYLSATQLTALVPAKLIASAGSATLTVTTAVGTSSPATFIITGPPSITTTTLPAATAGLAYSGPISVTGGSPGYAWTVTGLPSNFTYFNTSGSTLTITGIPASTSPISFQVAAQDTVGSIAGPVTLTINVKAGPTSVNNANLNGSYACLLQGSIDDDGTRWASILNFQADGQGNFTNGIFDTNSYDIGSASGIASGTYTLGADNQGQAFLHTVLTDNAAGIQTTQWAIALSNSAQPASEFRMVEDDDLGTLPSGQQGTAHCYRTTPAAFAAATLSGASFAFGLDGEDNSSNLKATIGQFTASNGAVTSGSLDTTLGGSATDQNYAFTGSYSAPDPVWGRFTLALGGAGASTGYTVYIIDANRMFILDNTSDDGEQAGNLRLQQTAATSTTAALSGPFVLYERGAAFNSNSGIPTSFYANLLLGSGDGAGNLAIQQSYANSAGAYTAGGSVGGPTALVFDPANPGRASFSTASGTTYLYFYAANRAFEMSIGTNGSVDSGWLEAQSQTAFTNAALTGSYLFGELPLLSVQPTAYAGEYSLNSSGALTAGFTTSAQGVLSWDQSLSTTYAWDTTATGTGGFFLANAAQGKASCASVSATRFACIPQTDPAPSVQIMQQ